MDPKHTGRLLYFDRDVWLPRVVAERGLRNVLPRHDFRDCVISGPAVVLLIGCELQDCRVAGSLEILPWHGPATRAPEDVPADGVIRLYRCSFERCVFEAIGFAAGPDDEPALRGLLPVAEAAAQPRRPARRAG
jgi:hypothetical protein